jgi:hypothetical protein
VIAAGIVLSVMQLAAWVDGNGNVAVSAVGDMSLSQVSVDRFHDPRRAFGIIRHGLPADDPSVGIKVLCDLIIIPT